MIFCGRLDGWVLFLLLIKVVKLIMDLSKLPPKHPNRQQTPSKHTLTNSAHKSVSTEKDFESKFSDWIFVESADRKLKWFRSNAARLVINEDVEFRGQIALNLQVW